MLISDLPGSHSHGARHDTHTHAHTPAAAPKSLFSSLLLTVPTWVVAQQQLATTYEMNIEEGGSARATMDIRTFLVCWLKPRCGRSSAPTCSSAPRLHAMRRSFRLAGWPCLAVACTTPLLLNTPPSFLEVRARRQAFRARRSDAPMHLAEVLVSAVCHPLHCCLNHCCASASCTSMSKLLSRPRLP